MKDFSIEGYGCTNRYQCRYDAKSLSMASEENGRAMVSVEDAKLFIVSLLKKINPQEDIPKIPVVTFEDFYNEIACPDCLPQEKKERH